MSRLPLYRLAPFIFAGCLIAVLPAVGGAAPPKPQKINIETFDKAQLQGTFYPSSQDGTKSPTVLMLHKIGGNRQQQGWESLAEELQEKGFAVLSFDFRGHGDSTEVKPAFWNQAANMRGIRGANAKKEKIDVKEFTPAYLPSLLNDIAAAKYTLELKHNAKECNVGDLFVIGAEDGAALGSIWAISEWDRRKRVLNAMGFPTNEFMEPEGKDVAACIWLSLKNRVGPGAGLPVPISAQLVKPKIKDKVPMCFFYGGDDQPSAALAKTLYENVLMAEKNKLKLTYKIELKGTKLAGNELLGKKTLGTDDLIVKYMQDKVMDSRGNTVWAERELKNYPLVGVPLTQFGFAAP